MPRSPRRRPPFPPRRPHRSKPNQKRAGHASGSFPFLSERKHLFHFVFCAILGTEIPREVKRRGTALLYRHRPEVLLRVGGVRGAGAGPVDDEPCRRRPLAHGKDHLPCRFSVAHGARDLRPCAAVRGRTAREGGQRPPPRSGARPHAHRRVKRRECAPRRPRAGGGLHRGASAHGEVH